MKRFLMGLLLFVALLVSMPAALAVDEPQITAVCEYIDATELPTVFSLSNTAWEDGWTSYKDQLTGDALGVYQALETAFANDSVPLVSIEYNDGSSAKSWWLDKTVACDYPQGDEDAFQEWAQEAFTNVIKACQAFSYDHPEYFWIRQGISYGYDFSDGKLWLSAGFAAQPSCDTVEERDALQDKVEPVIEQILTDSEGLGIVQRLEYFDNWLAANNHYNHTAANSSNYISEDDTPWSIVGALLDEDGTYSPVCEGYSKAFQLLCHEIGVPCLEISGYAGFGGHMWTAVKLDGMWYVCDPTWNDPGYVGGGDGASSTKVYFLVDQPSSHSVSMQTLITPEISDCDYSERWGDVDLGDDAVAKIAGVEQTNEGLQAGILFDKSMMEKSVTVLAAVYQDGKMTQLRWIDMTVYESGIQTIDLGEIVPEGSTFCLMITMGDWNPICEAFRTTQF